MKWLAKKIPFLVFLLLFFFSISGNVLTTNAQSCTAYWECISFNYQNYSERVAYCNVTLDWNYTFLQECLQEAWYNLQYLGIPYCESTWPQCV